MTDFIDSEKIQYKKLSQWNLEKEKGFMNLTVYEYYFHLWALEEHYQNDSSKN